MEISNIAVLCIGANRNATENIIHAMKKLRSLVNIINSSDIYSTPAVGDSTVKYHNIVVECSSDLHFDNLNAEFKRLEMEFGRDENCRKYGIVPLDVDIVIWNDNIIKPWDYSQTFFKIGFSKL